MSVRDDLKNTFNKQDDLGKLILAIVIGTVAFWILGFVYQPIVGWFKLPGDLFDFILQPWSIVTYAFLHSGFWHLLVNALFLYWFGRMFRNLFTARQLYTLFFSGVIAGGLLFMITQNIFPSYVKASGLIGASAGVFAVTFFVCSYSPEQTVRLIFIDVKLKYIAYALVIYVVFGLISRINTGGELAHLGGLLLGYYSATKMRDGIDILSGFAKTGDSFLALFKAKPKQAKKAKMKTVYRNKNASKSTTAASVKSEQQQKIDRILDKISESGYESLSKAEKDFLFKAGKE